MNPLQYPRSIALIMPDQKLTIDFPDDVARKNFLPVLEKAIVDHLDVSSDGCVFCDECVV